MSRARPGAVGAGSTELIDHQGTGVAAKAIATCRHSVLIARGVELVPCGARTLWSWVVGCCPFCPGSHLHRGDHAGGLRRAGGGGSEYRITGRGWLR